MLRPSMNSIIKAGDSTYAFVVAVAKRGRDIANEDEAEKRLSEEKPVKRAVEEFASGKYKMSNVHFE